MPSGSAAYRNFSCGLAARWSYFRHLVWQFVDRVMSHITFLQSPGRPLSPWRAHRHLAERSDAYDWVILGDEPVLIAAAESPYR
jgi:hypothetical protein